MCIVQHACLVLSMVTLLLWLTVKYVKLAKPKRTRMRQRQSLWKATLCSSGWRMSGDLYLGTVLRRTTSCQLSTSERFIPEQAKGWKGQVWPQHLRWGRNLLLPPSAVCCNGGLGKEKAPASDNGWNTPLHPHLVRRYFPSSAYFTLVYKQFLNQMFLCVTIQTSLFRRGKLHKKTLICRGTRSRWEKMGLCNQMGTWWWWRCSKRDAAPDRNPSEGYKVSVVWI